MPSVYSGLVRRERVALDPQAARDAVQGLVALAALALCAAFDPEGTTDGLLAALDPRVPPLPAPVPSAQRFVVQAVPEPTDNAVIDAVFEEDEP